MRMRASSTRYLGASGQQSVSTVCLRLEAVFACMANQRSGDMLCYAMLCYVMLCYAKVGITLTDCG